MKNSKNMKMIIILSVIILMFSSIVVYMAYFQLFKSSQLAANDLNVRNVVDLSTLRRGTIFDKDGNILAYSEKDSDGKYIRKNNYNYMYTNVIGYNSPSYGKTGLEKIYNNELTNNSVNKDILAKIEDMYRKPTRGKDLYLTIDNMLQSYAYDLLGEEKGAIIVTEVKTGKILAMVSKPTFNVNRLEEDWEEIINSNDANLLNRPTQGLYTPGSVFKLVTSIALLEENVSLDYDDKGKTSINGYVVRNFNGQVYGEMDLEKALQVSSNTYFVDKSIDLNPTEFKDILERFGLFKHVDYDFIKHEPIVNFSSGMKKEDKAASAFGQGKNVFTPMDMHMITMGIGNDGTVMKPYLVDMIKNEDKIELRNKSQILSKAIEPEIAKKIREYLKSTADYNEYTISSTNIGGKTGTAEIGDDYNNAWYTALAPIENPQYAVTVIIEKTKSLGGEVAAPIGLKILDYLFSGIQ